MSTNQLSGQLSERVTSMTKAGPLLLTEQDGLSVIIIEDPQPLVHHHEIDLFLTGLRLLVDDVRDSVLVVDLDGLSHISSLVLGEIVAQARVLRQRGVEVRLVAPMPIMREAMRVLRFDHLMGVYESMDAALADR